ncbi:hypothetical protein FXO37_24673 [Capsicum annuum]|nr:hypothetical protein FXO37_24673 [Capsicum annuum]
MTTAKNSADVKMGDVKKSFRFNAMQTEENNIKSKNSLSPLPPPPPSNSTNSLSPPPPSNSTSLLRRRISHRHRIVKQESSVRDEVHDKSNNVAVISEDCPNPGNKITFVTKMSVNPDTPSTTNRDWIFPSQPFNPPRTPARRFSSPYPRTTLFQNSLSPPPPPSNSTSPLRRRISHRHRIVKQESSVRDEIHDKSNDEDCPNPGNKTTSVDKKFARLFRRFTVSRQAACIIAVTSLALSLHWLILPNYPYYLEEHYREK